VFALSYTHVLALMVICHTLIYVYPVTYFFATCSAVHNSTSTLPYEYVPEHCQILICSRSRSRYDVHATHEQGGGGVSQNDPNASKIKVACGVVWCCVAV